MCLPLRSVLTRATTLGTSQGQIGSSCLWGQMVQRATACSLHPLLHLTPSPSPQASVFTRLYALKKRFECFYRFGRRPRIAVCGDSFQEIRSVEVEVFTYRWRFVFHAEGDGHLSLFLIFFQRLILAFFDNLANSAGGLHLHNNGP